MERTLVLVKPDGVQRGLIGEVISRFEGTGLKVTGLKLIHISNDLAGRHYAEHEGKPFYEGLITFITSSPSVAMVLEGTNAVSNVRKMMGVTDPSGSQPGTIRGDYGLDLGRNIVHGSANLDDAAREVSLFFEESEIASYDRAVDPWIYE